MVVQGGFSLELVDAETQVPLNEYRGPSGSVFYAEAKPNGEYFLRFQVLREDLGVDAAVGDDAQQRQQHEHQGMVYFRPSVDGKDLGFYTNLTYAQGARDVGLWTYVNGIGTNKALKFETATDMPPATVVATSSTGGSTGEGGGEDDSNSSSSSKPSGPPLLHMGNVQVQVSKAIFTGYQKRVYSSVPPLSKEETVVAAAPVSISASSSLHEDDDVNQEATNSSAHNSEAGANNSDHPSSSTANSSSCKSYHQNLTNGSLMDPVPVLRSREGAACFQEEITEECPTYKPGELLETITIHYGSTEALVQAGILVPTSSSAGGIPQYVGIPPPAVLAAEDQHPAPTTTLTPGLVPNPLEGATPAVSTTKLLDSGNGNSNNNSNSNNNNNKRALTPSGESDESKPPASKKVCQDGLQQQQSKESVLVAASVVSTN